jgi:glycosyltransferase involved in cell wall biosynthesis
MNLILFTASYPYIVGGEQNFLETEIKCLRSAFDRVSLVPQNIEGQRPKYLPEGVEVEDEYAKLIGSYSRTTTVLRGIFSLLFIQDVLKRPSLLFFPIAIKRLAFCAGRAELTRRWVIAWLKKQGRTGSDCIFYTYWFDQATVGIGLTKRHFPKIKLISRAHNYDLYEQYYKYPYWPCRLTALSNLDHLFPCSNDGVRYISELYPDNVPNCSASFLGITDPGFLTVSSNDGIFRIISCSIVRPDKRVERILESIRNAAQQRPNIRFEWHHIGNGDTRNTLEKIVKETFPSNANGYFRPYLSNADLMEFYKQNPVDVFINLSEAEGIPVSIMEAISCGIPVIATAVGGNPEIALKQNGILVSPDPKPEEVASAIFSLIDNPSETKNKRRESRQIWQIQYNADVNFLEFAEKLRTIRQEP